LAQGGGLIGQIADLKAKKAELEERGLAITHQTAMTHMEGQIANEKIKQLSMSLDMAEQTTNEAIVNKQWSDASPEQWNEMVRENDRAVTESKEAAGKALGAVAEENAGMPLSALPPENRAVHHELKRGTAAASLLDAALKKHLLDWATETGEKGEFITKGSEDFDERVFAFIKQHKAANEILEGTPADNNYNLSLRTYFNNVLPALKEDFLEAHKKADLNNQIRQAAATLQTIPEADGTTPPLPVAGLDPGGTVLPPKNAQQEYIQSNQWAEIRGKNNDEFDLFMQNTLMALIGEKTYEAIKAGYNLLDMADADPDFKGYRGGKFGGSNHYNALKALLDAAEENLDTAEVKRKNAKINALVEELEGPLQRTVYPQTATVNDTAMFMSALADDVSLGRVTTLLEMVGRESEAGKRLTDLDLDETAKLNNTIIGLIPAMQKNARMGNSQSMQAILGGESFSFAQMAHSDVNVILAAIPDKDAHDRLQKAFGMAGQTIGGFGQAEKTAKLLKESALSPPEVSRVNRATEAWATGTRLKMGQQLRNEFINDPDNPEGTKPSPEAMLRMMLGAQDNLMEAWPVVWAKHAQELLDEKAYEVATDETQRKAIHAESQLGKEEPVELEPQKAWELVKIARPLEKQDEKRLKGLTPGTPEYAIESKKQTTKRKEQGIKFLKQWEKGKNWATGRELRSRIDASELLEDAHTGITILRKGEVWKHRAPGQRLGTRVTMSLGNRLEKREQGIEAQKVHAEKYINLLGFGMEYGEVLNTVKTGSINGKPTGGYIIGLYEEYTSGKSFRNSSKPLAGKASELTPEWHEALSARADNFVPSDTFSVILPPITNLPMGGAVRTGSGAVKSINLPAIRAALEASDSDLYALTKAYGFAQEPAADPSLEGPPERPSAAEKEKSIIKFLTHQYNTPYLRSKFSISK
jgi:hypothetical protein